MRVSVTRRQFISNSARAALACASVSLFGVALGGCSASEPSASFLKSPDRISLSNVPDYEKEQGYAESERPWNLVLANRWNPLPDGYVPKLATLAGSYEVDERIVEATSQLLDGCRGSGCNPVVCSAFRSQEYQAELLRNSVELKMAAGMTEREATEKALRSLAAPGTSEHQLGLALDIVDKANQNLTEAQESTPVSRWMKEHCWDYGFILRYPNDKTEITGIIYEPWHYRFVGLEVARTMRKSGQCLEEYLEE